MCGLIAANHASVVVLTDYQEIVMDLIDINIQTCNPKPNDCELFAAQLDWEKMDDPNFYDSLDYTNKDQTVEGKFRDIQFDYVIGSDIVYWPQSIQPLYKVLLKLFERQPNLVFYICYIERSVNVHTELLATLKKSFKIEEIGQEITKPITPSAYIYRITRLG